MASDLLWDEVQDLFNPDLMGSLPDLCVPDTSVQDWQRLLDLILASGWRFEYSKGDTILPLPSAAAVFERAHDSEYPALRVWPSDQILVIFWFSGSEEIDFDVDLREIQGQERLDDFCGFLRTLGRHLDKPVLMDGEMGNPAEHPVLGFFPGTDQVVVIPPPANMMTPEDQ